MMDSGDRMVVLADDTRLITDEGAGAASGALWCWLHDITINEAMQLFLNPTLTAHIRFVYGNLMDVFDGYTKPILFAVTNRGVNVQLTGVPGVPTYDDYGVPADIGKDGD